LFIEIVFIINVYYVLAFFSLKIFKFNKDLASLVV